jgi:hypothetical protein
MNTNPKRNETFPLNETVVLSDKALDHVAGGLNPQPLPPRDPNPGEAKAGRALTLGVW